MEALYPKTACLTKAGLVLDNGATTYDLAALVFAIDGKAYSKTSVSNGAFPTTDAHTGAAFKALSEDQGCTLLVCVNSAGTVSVAQGEIRDLDPDSGDFYVQPQLPHPPANTCPVAYVVLKYTGSTTFTPGTSNWDAAGIAKTIQDIVVMPPRGAF